MLTFISGLIILSTCILSSVRANETLVSVQMVVRHGARENDNSFPAGTGQLTPSGKLQMYNFGLFLRQRYGGLVKTEFDPAESIFISSSKDRSVNSASLIIYGLYRNFNVAASWSGKGKNIRYEPIPVRMIPTELDKYLQMSRDCPRRTVYEAAVDEKWSQEFTDKYPTLVATFEEKIAPLKGSNIILFQDEVSFNLSSGLPIREDWMMEFATNPDLISTSLVLNERTVATAEMKRLMTGSLLDLIVKNFEENSTKLTVYSGHDRFMLYLLITLGVWDYQQLQMPPTGSAIIIELYRSNHQDPHPEDLELKLSYRKDSDADPHYLEIPSCPSPCTLSTFKKAFQSVLNVNFDDECQLTSESSIGVSFSRPLAVTLALVVLGSSVTLLMWWNNRRRSYSMI